MNAQDKTAIVYLSRTQNTKVLAEIIQKKVGGSLISLELVNPYPEDYEAIVAQVARENASDFLPTLKTEIEIDDYDSIFLGFPTWGMQLPPPIRSFLNQYDLQGKEVYPFNTNAGYGLGKSEEQLSELCKGCHLSEVLSLKGGIERDGVYLAIKGNRKQQAQQNVDAWLKEIGVNVKK